LFSANTRHQIRIGGQLIHHAFSVGTQSFTSRLGSNNQDTLLEQPVIPAWESGVYIEDDWKISPALGLRVGIHWATFSVRDTTYQSLQPRLSLRWSVNEKLSIKAFWSTMAQYLHLLTNSGVGLPTDLWVPPTNKILPQQSWQVGLGGVYQLTKGYSVSLEGYYKQLDNTLEYREGTDFVEVSENWEDQVVQGVGENYGVEVLVRKERGKLRGWVGYTLSWAERQSDQLNFGRPYPYKFDRRHDLGLAMQYQWKENIHVSGNWVFGSGYVTTLPTLRYSVQTPYYNTTESILHYEGRNNFRMPAYHRLDLSISFTKQKKRGKRIWTFGLYNAYNRQNPFFLEVRPDFNESYRPGEPQPSFVWQQSLFPVLPSASYKFTF
ncbi:MAG: TonB-dependent receptor, partial [Bacteroidota bacterium]